MADEISQLKMNHNMGTSMVPMNSSERVDGGIVSAIVIS